jgi:hypothetical protein
MANFSVCYGFDLPCPVFGEWVLRYLRTARAAPKIGIQVLSATQFATPAELAFRGHTLG